MWEIRVVEGWRRNSQWSAVIRIWARLRLRKLKRIWAYFRIFRDTTRIWDGSLISLEREERRRVGLPHTFFLFRCEMSITMGCSL